jgi:hypothetical protein
MGHPVAPAPISSRAGTRRSKIVLAANPEFRGFVWDFQPTDDTWEQGRSLRR